MTKVYKNLVFEVNGAVGVAYCGAIKALEKRNLRKHREYMEHHPFQLCPYWSALTCRPKK
ncbi:MAG: hypothetical protein AB8G05_17620 [Oligoflexales bacterium]